MNRHSAVFLRIILVVAWLMDSRRLGVFEQEAEILPEIFSVADRRRHVVRQLVDGDEHERVVVDEGRIVVFGIAIQAKSRLLALVFTKGRERARGERLVHALGVESRHEFLHAGVVAVMLAHVLNELDGFLRDARQFVGGLDFALALAHAVFVAVDRGDDTFELEFFLHIVIVIGESECAENNDE